MEIENVGGKEKAEKRGNKLEYKEERMKKKKIYKTRQVIQNGHSCRGKTNDKSNQYIDGNGGKIRAEN